MTKNQAKKYFSAIKNSKRKNVTCDSLSREIGIYPEMIADALSYFEPMLIMDPTFNLRDLLPQIKDFLAEPSKDAPKKVTKPITKKEVLEYKSIGEFVYKKMTINGLVDKNMKLSEADLRLMKKLIQKDLDQMKKRK